MPGGKFGNNDSQELDPISGKLKSWGPLTATLAEALEELQSGGGVLNPRKLFCQLTKMCPQFGGGDQHDSHELLRHLLEGVKYVSTELDKNSSAFKSHSHQIKIKINLF